MAKRHAFFYIIRRIVQNKVFFCHNCLGNFLVFKITKNWNFTQLLIRTFLPPTNWIFLVFVLGTWYIFRFGSNFFLQFTRTPINFIPACRHWISKISKYFCYLDMPTEKLKFSPHHSVTLSFDTLYLYGFTFLKLFFLPYRF